MDFQPRADGRRRRMGCGEMLKRVSPREKKILVFSYLSDTLVDEAVLVDLCRAEKVPSPTILSIRRFPPPSLNFLQLSSS